jgi:hypothetical protein
MQVKPLAAAQRLTLACMFEAIEATDWAAIPGPADIYAPEEIAPSLRALALATDEASAYAAIMPLAGGGLFSRPQRLCPSGKPGRSPDPA